MRRHRGRAGPGRRQSVAPY